ncbi:MAG TPA: DUF4013 domain-containing protein [Anaerolineales bacterium]|nr:DUF4013 domain-containing protein [Anaerolineales bacterium]
MLFGFNLNDLFLFPIQTGEARKHFLIGCLIYLAGFFIPILPWLVVSGYSALLIRQVLNGEKLHLVPWENWEALLKDGARMFGIRLVYSSPMLILMMPIFFLFFAGPFIAIFLENSEGSGGGFIYLISMFVGMAAFLIMMPLSLVIGLIVPAAEIHTISKDDFMAGFQVREWWPIFKKNWGGFLVALAIMYGIMMVMSMVMQVAFMTLVFICLLPIFLPVVSMYMGVVQYAAFAQAYKDGRDRLQLPAPVA